MSHDRSVEDPLIMFESHKIDIQYICEPFGGYDQGLLRSAPVTLQISSINDLYEIVTGGTYPCRSLYIISQNYSWGQLQVTEEAFEAILSKHRVYSPYWNVVNCFGFKKSATDDILRRPPFYGYISTADESHLYEICYILQFVESNGRSRGDPWSLRHIGVYQQVDRQRRNSTWIILKSSPLALPQVEEGFRTVENDVHLAKNNSMALHWVILEASKRNWLDYVKHLQEEANELIEKASFSKLDNAKTVMKKREYDAAATITNVQDLHELQQKLLRTSVVMSSCIEVAEQLGSHCHKLRESYNHALSSADFHSSLQGYKAEIERHKQSLTMIKQTLKCSERVLIETITFRNEQLLRSINENTFRSIEDVRNITTQIRRENNDFARQTQRDSRTLKAMTTVALMFIPVSLLATIFNSNLILLVQDPGLDSGSSHYKIVPQFWIFVLTSIGMIILTLLVSSWLDWRWGKAASQ